MIYKLLIKISPVTKHTSTLLFSALLLLIWSCSTPPTYFDNSIQGMAETGLREDSIYLSAKSLSKSDADSSIRILHQLMAQTVDSTTYYNALGLALELQVARGSWDSVYCWKSQMERYGLTPPFTTAKSWILSKAYNAMGVYYAQNRQMDSSIYFLEKALSMAPPDNLLRAKVNIYINLGDSYFRKGELANGADYYRLAQHEADSLQTTEYNFEINFGLGQIYSAMKDSKNSLYYFDLAQQDLANVDKTEQYTYFNNRGNHHFLFEEYPKALFYFRKAHQLVLSKSFDFQRYITEINLADTYIALNNIDSATLYIYRGDHYFQQYGHTSILDYTNHIKAEIAQRQSNYRTAKLLLDQPMVANMEPNLEMLILKKRTDIYARNGEFAVAYQNMMRFNQIRDSILNQQAIQRIADIDLRYKQDTALLKQNIIIEQKQGEINQIQLSLSIWISLSVILLLAIGILYISVKQRHDRKFYQYVGKIAQLRMQSIRNRVSPHFIFNLLNREIHRGSEQQPSSERLLALSQMLRSSLDMTEDICVPLDKEIEFVKNYISIEQETLNDRFQFALSVDHTLNTETIYIPSMILQIPVENSIKHGLRPLEGDQKLWLHIDKKEEGVEICIEDNGVGYGTQPATQTQGTGVGLRVIYQTIELLNRQNRRKIVFDIHPVDDSEVTTRVSIFIPNQYKYHLN